MALVAFGLCGAWPSPAFADNGIDIACPCTVEFSNLTSVSFSFGVRNLNADYDTGPLSARLLARHIGQDHFWQVATVDMPSVPANSIRQGEKYTAPFRLPPDSGQHELKLQLSNPNSFFPLESVTWLVDHVELKVGGSSTSSFYFEGVPTITLGEESATVKLPVLKNQTGGLSVNGLTVELRAHSSIADGGRLLGGLDLGQGLEPGKQLSAREIVVPISTVADDKYVLLVILSDNRIGLTSEIVAAPEGEEMPSRNFVTGNADTLVDSDEDGVGDVNERLVGTDPEDAESSPPDSTIDVMGLYYPSFADLYDGDATTRIRHVLTLASSIYQDSNTGVKLRLVGTVEVEEGALNKERFVELSEQHGADLSVLFRPHFPGSRVCGGAPLGGLHQNGAISYSQVPTAVVYGNCGASTTAHELGHMMGLGHSIAQGGSGTFRWARGHGVDASFVTVMAYQQEYGNAPRIDVFSDPDQDCNEHPCGVEMDQVTGADSVAALIATRFQIERIGEEQPDTDDDGFVDSVDALPNDPDDHLDYDGDGTGDRTDEDDDGDGVADVSDLFPLDSRDWADSDSDGVGDNTDAFPRNPAESSDRDGDGVGDNADVFPEDPTETVDTDHDGVGNNSDAFPFDTRDWRDTDGDGVGDNVDTDADNDGVADLVDTYPYDANRSDASSYVLNLAEGSNQALSLSHAGDVDSDGRADFLIGAVHYGWDGRGWSSTAYLVGAAGIDAADAADGTKDRLVHSNHLAAQSGTWKFVAESEGDKAGFSVASAGDVNGDGVPEVLIGAPGHHGGAAYLISGKDLPAADSADGESDGIIALGNIAAQPNSWKLVGETESRGNAGSSVSLLGDIDDDGLDEFFIGAPGRRSSDSEDPGAGYIVSGKSLVAADSADGDADGVIRLGNVAEQTGSWKLVGENARDFVGSARASSYLDTTGGQRLILSAPGQDSGSTRGTVYLISVGELEAADKADDTTDGIVKLAHAASQPSSWRIHGTFQDRAMYAAPISDMDGDELTDLLVRTARYAFFLSSADFELADSNDGIRDHAIVLHRMDAPNSWAAVDLGDLSGLTSMDLGVGRMDGDELDDVILISHGFAYLLPGRLFESVEDATRLDQFKSAEGPWQLGARPDWISSVATAGDVDADGDDDLLLGAEGKIYLVVAGEMEILDAAENATDGAILLNQIAGDADADGISNMLDHDDDNDGYLDSQDKFPLDASDWEDRDYDGVGDNTDAFPDNRNEQLDTDADGIGNRADTDDDDDGINDDMDEFPLDTDNDGSDNVVDSDDDNDGVEDSEDAFPLDSEESSDFDSDGVGDAADTDDDNDGVADGNDALPFNAAESKDRDGDGVGDNSDAFPENPDESVDTDGDGQGNNADADDDNDGTTDASDVFPLDATEAVDSDEDGVGDNADAFPENKAEWIDTDRDGVGDNADTDDDGDGFTDGADYYPLDPNRDRLFLFRLWGEHPGSWTGRAVGDAGDVDSDGRAEVLIAAPGRPYPKYGQIPEWDSHGTLHIASGPDLVAADLSDGARDGRIDIGRIVAQPQSWAVRGQESQDHLGHDLALAGDLDGDGKPDWIVGASGRNDSKAAAYVLSSANVTNASPVDSEEKALNVADILTASGSWELTGEGRGDDNDAGTRVALVGDTDGDGKPEFLIGTPYYSEDDSNDAEVPGAAFLVSSAHLTSSNTTDAGGSIDITTLQEASGAWMFLGEADGDMAGASVTAAGDIDGDGRADFAIGAYGHTASRRGDGAIYLVAAADLAAADDADGETDRTIRLKNVHSQSSSWKLIGETWDELVGYAMTSGDMNGDGEVELIIVSPTPSFGRGAVYVLPTGQLATVDAADGMSDGIIDLGQVASQPNAWKLLGEGYHARKDLSIGFDGPSVAAADLDYDGADELIIGVPRRTGGIVACGSFSFSNPSGAVYVVSGAALSSADSADGEVDGVILFANVALQARSWKFIGSPSEYLGSSVAVLGDLDGDGFRDLAIGAANQHGLDENCRYTYGKGFAFIVSGAELAMADYEDGAEDGVISISQISAWYKATDFDLDGIEDAIDPDDDNDGYADTGDAFPKDPAESLDSDYDGIGNNADEDDDNDGVADVVDPFPYDPYETSDNDGDGVGDSADLDDDNDGVADLDDAFPLDPAEWSDEDGDGIGDNIDSFSDNPNADTDGDGTTNGTDTDDDNDGVLDADDLFPLNANKSDLFFYMLRGETRPLTGSDFDGDGRNDLIVKSASAQNTVFLVSAADISDVDDDDGETDHVVDFDQASSLSNSWKFVGVPGTQYLAPAGDVDFDEQDDVVAAGSQDTFVVPMSSMQAADAADGQSDRSITLGRNLEGSTVGAWRLTAAELERGVYSLADTNADGHMELLIGAPMLAPTVIPVDPFSGVPINTNIPFASGSTAYVASGADWAAADDVDDSDDGVIDIDQWIARSGTFKLRAQSDAGSGAAIARAGDFDGDGYEDLMVSVPGSSIGGVLRAQTVYLLSGMKLGSFDAADGTTDGTIRLNQALGEGFWHITGANFDPERALSTAGDVDADGLSDLIIAGNDGVYLIAASDMAAADAADGTSDRKIQVANAVAQPGSFQFSLGANSASGLRVAGVGDIDRDSKDDILVTRSGSSEAHLIAAKDFHELDATNGNVDVSSLSALSNSWILKIEGSDTLFDGTASSVDLDGDDRPELIIGVYAASDTTAKAAYVISAVELAIADTLDDAQDRSIALDSVAERWASD